MKERVRPRKFFLSAAFLIVTLLSKFVSAQSDACGTAPTILSSPAPGTCTLGTLSAVATYTAGGGVPGCGSATKDVWYKFVALTTNPTITYTAGTLASGRIQLFSGSCGALTSLLCGTTLAASGLTIGSTYYIRIYSTTGAAGSFTVCITDPAPSNNLCGGATVLTSGTACVNTAGNMYGSTLTATTITAPDCSGGLATYDVWYKFVAQTTNPTITLSSLGASFAGVAGMQLLSNSCGGTFTNYFCGTTSIAADFLAPGTTYFIRVYGTGALPTTSTGFDFNICITDPVASPPFNDECANAINLPVGVNTCSTLPTTIAGATASAVPIAPCTGPVAYDVWYKFTATSTSTTITLGGAANNFTSRQLQILSGSCGSLTSVACGASPLAFASTAGTIYYIRAYSTTGPAPNGNADFTICVNGGANAPIRFGNSYVNVSKRTNGGVVQPGDTLEIRLTINHTSGTMTALRYVDNVPTKTSMLTGAGDFIRVITNEGLTYKQYTLAGGDDAATYKASPGAGEYNIRLNLGFGGSSPGIPVNNTNGAASATGQMNAATDRPRGGGGMLFATSYRVVVTGAPGDTITLFPGQFIYNNAGTDVTLTATPFKILISNPLNLCANSIGLNNAVENGGTFGAGSTLNRSTDLTTPIAGYTFVPNVSANVSVNDGRYAIVKNLSPRSDVVSGARRQPNCNVAPPLAPNDPLACVNRMFTGFWYIDGDHSGTNNAAGNPPPASTTPAGYMLMVNADYVASEVFRQTVNNLCPNTYYEFSAWIRNICPNCGIDSTGSSTYKPGVLPNLTFTLDSLDYYNTGEVDTFGWMKKGFVFKTAPAQTTASFSIRNNSQGGGGNDWALDDIAIATCLPTMVYSPTINPTVCQGNSLVVNDTVSSYFNNYTYYKWQRSTDNGSSWTDVSTTNNASLTYNGSTYQFITSDTIPPSMTNPSDSGDLYRVIVATSNTNLLNSSCLFTDASTIITLKVLNCGPVLGVDLISFSGKNNSGNADLLWVTSSESEPVFFDIEKSSDGTHFNRIGTVNGHGNNSSEYSYYHFTDPERISGKVWYRILMYSKAGFKKYSRIISLDDKTVQFALDNVVNPFANQLDFELSVPENSRIDVVVANLLGKPVRKESFNVYAGVNSLSIQNTENLPAGMYILQVKDKDTVINKKVMKK